MRTSLKRLSIFVIVMMFFAVMLPGAGAAAAETKRMYLRTMGTVITAITSADGTQIQMNKTRITTGIIIRTTITVTATIRTTITTITAMITRTIITVLLSPLMERGRLFQEVE